MMPQVLHFAVATLALNTYHFQQYAPSPTPRHCPDSTAPDAFVGILRSVSIKYAFIAVLIFRISAILWVFRARS
jgi:hypothetical protein